VEAQNALFQLGPADHLLFVRRPSCWRLMIFMKQNSPPGRAGDAYQFFGRLRADERLRLDGLNGSQPPALCFGWLRILCLSNRVAHPNRLFSAVSRFLPLALLPRALISRKRILVSVRSRAHGYLSETARSHRTRNDSSDCWHNGTSCVRLTGKRGLPIYGKAVMGWLGGGGKAACGRCDMIKFNRTAVTYDTLRKECLETIRQWPGCENPGQLAGRLFGEGDLVRSSR
jgi:hypothetical protein